MRANNCGAVIWRIKMVIILFFAYLDGNVDFEKLTRDRN